MFAPAALNVQIGMCCLGMRRVVDIEMGLFKEAQVPPPPRALHQLFLGPLIIVEIQEAPFLGVQA